MRCFALGAIGAALASSCGRQRPPGTLLVTGRRIDGVIPAGGAALFRISAPAGRFVSLVVGQGAADLAVDLARGSGHDTVDGFDFGTEPVSFLHTGGEAQVSVRRSAPGDPTPAHFSIELREISPPAHGDLDEIRAERLFSKAKRMLASSPGEALALSREALSVWQGRHEVFAEASARLRIGELLYSAGNLRAARTEFATALDDGRSINDRRTIAEALTDLGAASWRLDDIEAASRSLNEGLREWQDLSYPPGEASALNNLGLLDWETGEWQKALDEYLLALHLIHGNDQADEALVLNNLGLIYLSLGRFEDAKDYLSRALTLFRPQTASVSRALALTNLARAQMLSGDREGARKLLNEAQGLLPAGADASASADILNNLGQEDLRSRHFPAAREDFLRAAALYRGTENRSGEASAWHHAGVALASMHQPEAARQYLWKAFRIRSKLQLQDDAAASLYELARAERDGGNLAQALGLIERAVTTVEGLRGRAASEAFRSSYFATKQDYYDEYIDDLMELNRRFSRGGYDRRAFEISERSRARAFMESMTEARGNIRNGVAPEQLARERELNRRLNFLSYQLSSGPEPNAASSQLRRELSGTLQEYRECEALIRQRSPAYAALVSPRPLSLPEIQRMLPGGTLLLEFTLGRRRSYAWAVTATEFRGVALPNRERIESDARMVVDLVRDYRARTRSAGLDQRFREARAALRDDLFSAFGSLPECRRLVVVSDGILHYVPFAALEWSRKSLVPLGIFHEIVQLPSASTEAVFQRLRRPPSDAIVVFADPVFDAQDPRVHQRRASPSTAAPPGSLARLPFSRREASWIQRFAGGAEVVEELDFDASKANFMRICSMPSHVIHLSTHAHIDDLHPETTWTAFSLVTQGGARQDGLLHQFETYNLHLATDLITVSACESALGENVSGEGMMSVARGLFYAGAQRVLVSLWPVEDEGAEEFMRLFYERYLGTKHSPAPAALSEARRAMWGESRWRDPYFWSAFILEGDLR